jgi:hypothetical protein
VRFEQAFDDNGKFDAGTWIRRKKFFPNGHIEHTPKYPEFLVHGGWLHESSFVIPILRFYSNSLTKAFSKEQFNIVGSNFEQLMGSKSIAEMLCRPLVRVMGF